MEEISLLSLAPVIFCLTKILDSFLPTGWNFRHIFFNVFSLNINCLVKICPAYMIQSVHWKYHIGLFFHQLGLKCQFEDSQGCLIMILLREVPLILLRVVVQLHSILAKNHDFAAQSPNDFAACSPPIIFTVRTTCKKINYGQP